MIKNYLRSAWRNLSKHKFISFINIFGLTTGLTCCLLILVYILNELSYDKFNDKADRIYRVTRIFYNPDKTENLHLGAIAPPFGPLLQSEYHDVESMTRVLPNGTTALHYKDKLFNEKNVFYGDDKFFDFFIAPVIKGDKQNMLAEPNTILLTESMAKKYFGDEDPLNKLIRFDSKYTFKVTGVYKQFPANAHFHPDILISFSTLRDSTIYGEKNLLTNYGNNAFFTYLLLPKDYQADKLEASLPSFLDKRVHFKGMPANVKTSMATKLTLQKLTDIHLHSRLADEAEDNGDITRVYIFAAIAIFILLIACINYMNLSTARSAIRAREIGIRKVIGAQRKEIILQFLSESVLITYLALVLAFFIAWLILPLIDNLSGQTLQMNSLLSAGVIIPLLLLPMVVGLISGIYPALFMSSFKPIRVLKGLISTGNAGISFRKVLVVTQFTISIILIVATVVVFQQLRYMDNRSLGFSKDHMVTMPYITSLNNQYDAFRNDLLKNASIKDAGRSSRIPSGRLLDDLGAAVMIGGSIKPTSVDIKFVSVDHEFIPTYGIQMAAGRNFSRSFSTDTVNYIINETAVKMLNWKSPEAAIGKDMKYGNVTGKVIGVTKDFHFESLHQKIIPLLLTMPSLNYKYYGELSVKIDGNNIPATLATMQQVWHKYMPDTPFEYSFLDAQFDQLYKSEQQQGSLFTIFSCIAIFIACLGLFGLSAFTITQRFKEIGIRKVLGASVPQIVSELSKDFVILVVLAAFIAFPVSWLAMNRWLLSFAYRIDIQWWVFLLAGIMVAIIAFVTIGFQSVKAAIANPVKSLRSE